MLKRDSRESRWLTGTLSLPLRDPPRALAFADGAGDTLPFLLFFIGDCDVVRFCLETDRLGEGDYDFLPMMLFFFGD